MTGETLPRMSIKKIAGTQQSIACRLRPEIHASRSSDGSPDITIRDIDAVNVWLI